LRPEGLKFDLLSEVIQKDREFLPRDSKEGFDLTCSAVYAFDKRQEPVLTAGICIQKENLCPEGMKF
jgi:hypothetical protein